MTFTASDVLLKAASRIEEEGMWCRGRFFDIQDSPEASDVAFHFRKAMTQRVPECAAGALISATVEMGLPMVVFDDAQRRLANALGVTGFASSIGEWNDEPGRTAAEVAEAMRRAAL